ncbi:AraC family transcriptional regulator, partial [bacterium]|nr:AraC family transcriptional regulator [bacterium]
MDVFQNMALLAELVQCGGPIFTWCYDEKGNLLRSNCPDQAFLSGVFDLFGCKQQMMEYGTDHDPPITLGTALGILWAAAFEKENGRLKRAWVIGPVFYQDVSMRGIEQGLHYYNRLETSVSWTMHLQQILAKIPVVQNTILHRYTLMMHYCLTG